MTFSFYTYGAFSVYVDAFKRIALFFAQTNTLLISFFICGILIAALVSSVSSLQSKISSAQDRGNPILGHLFIAVIGLAIYQGMTAQKSTMIIYDERYNKMESVAGVPWSIAAFANIGSSIISSFRKSDNLASAYTYGDMSQSSPLTMVISALNAEQYYDGNLLKSISTFYPDCVIPARTRGAISGNDLKGNTDDLWALLVNAKHKSIITTVYDNTNPQGYGATCEEAYNAINSVISQPSTYEKHLKAICKSINLDATNATEKATCSASLENTINMIYSGSATNSISALVGLRNIITAKRLITNLTNNPNAYAQEQLTRKGLADSAGAFAATARFMPTIHGVLFSITLASVPLLFAFIVTPLVGRALLTFAGLLIFYIFAVVCDIFVVTVIEDNLQDLFNGLRLNKMGIAAIHGTNEVVGDAFSLLGAARSVGLTMAIFLTSQIIRISPHALAGIGQKMEGKVEQEGAQTGRETMLPEVMGATMGNLSANVATANRFANNPSGAMLSDAYGQNATQSTNNAIVGMSGSMINAVSTISNSEASSAVGTARAVQNEGVDKATDAAQINKERSLAQAEAITQVAAQNSQSTRDSLQTTASFDESKANSSANTAIGTGTAISEGTKAGVYEGSQEKARIDAVDTFGSKTITTTESQNIADNTATVEGRQSTGFDLYNEQRKEGRAESVDQHGRNIGRDEFTTSDQVSAAAVSMTEDIARPIGKLEEAGSLYTIKETSEFKGRAEEGEDATNKAKAEQAIDSGAFKSVTDYKAASADTTTFNLTEEQAQRLNKDGVVSDKAVTIAQNEGGVTTRINQAADRDENGNLNLHTVNEVSEANQSATVDKSTALTSGTRIEDGVRVDDGNTARAIIMDSEKLNSYVGSLQAEKGLNTPAFHNEVGHLNKTAFMNQFDITESDRNENLKSLSTTAETSIGGGIGPLSGKVSAAAEARGSDFSESGTQIDRMQNDSARISKGIMDYAIANTETETEAKELYSDLYSGFQNKFSESVATDKQNQDFFDISTPSERYATAFNEYSKENNLGFTIGAENEKFTAEQQEKQAIEQRELAEQQAKEEKQAETKAFNNKYFFDPISKVASFFTGDSNTTENKDGEMQLTSNVESQANIQAASAVGADSEASQSNNAPAVNVIGADTTQGQSSATAGTDSEASQSNKAPAVNVIGADTPQGQSPATAGTDNLNVNISNNLPSIDGAADIQQNNENRQTGYQTVVINQPQSETKNKISNQDNTQSNVPSDSMSVSNLPPANSTGKVSSLPDDPNRASNISNLPPVKLNI